MAVEHLGSKTIGGAVAVIPLVLPVLSATLADLLSRIAALTAQAEASLAIALTPPDPAALLAQLSGVVTSALASIEAIITAIPGSLVSASASFRADVAALLGLRGLLTELLELLGGAVSLGGVHAFRVDSRASELAGELGAYTSGGLPGGGLPGARVRGVVLLTEDPATAAMLGRLLV